MTAIEVAVVLFIVVLVLLILYKRYGSGVSTASTPAAAKTAAAVTGTPPPSQYTVGLNMNKAGTTAFVPCFLTVSQTSGGQYVVGGSATASGPSGSVTTWQIDPVTQVLTTQVGGQLMAIGTTTGKIGGTTVLLPYTAGASPIGLFTVGMTSAGATQPYQALIFNETPGKNSGLCLGVNITGTVSPGVAYYCQNQNQNEITTQAYS